MGIDLNLGLAFVAGLLSFLSPCILPLIPAYLSLMGGTSLQDLKESGSKRLGAFVNTVFFVIGFSIVFMVLGILFSTTFALLSGATRIINIVAGSIVVVLGFNFIFDFWKVLNFEKRFQVEKRPTSKPAALLFGMAFGAGWSPCIGPILSSILFLAGSTGSFVRAIVLLSVYSLGLGLPFLLTGLFLPFALRQLDRAKKHLRTIKIVSGGFLVFIGALIIFGRLQQLNILLFSFAYKLETWEVDNPIVARNVFGAVFFIFFALVLAFYIRKGLARRTEESAGSTVQPIGPGGQDKPPPDGGTAVAKPLSSAGSAWFRPVRLFFLLAFLSGGVLSLTGVINVSKILSAWFSFQGI
jgi:cytochrome c-type biogenesis protein